MYKFLSHPHAIAPALVAVQAPAAGAGEEPVIDTGVLRDIRRTLSDLAAQHQRAVGEFTENLPEEVRGGEREGEQVAEAEEGG